MINKQEWNNDYETKYFWCPLLTAVTVFNFSSLSEGKSLHWWRGMTQRYSQDICLDSDVQKCSIWEQAVSSRNICIILLSLVTPLPSREREEGSGDTAIPNAFCWNAIISIIRHAHITCTLQLYHQCWVFYWVKSQLSLCSLISALP